MELRALTSSDLPALLSFYAGLSKAVCDMFEPFGPVVAEEKLRTHLADTENGVNVSYALFDGASIVGHVFIWNIESDAPVFGIGLADRAQGQGWGRKMANRVLVDADARGKKVSLTVIKKNLRAIALYETLGFRRTGDATFRTQADSLAMDRPSARA
jgi:ribosomal protein S18 acetylase RimI-like enzyme